MSTLVRFALRGPGGEPVDFLRTINGHGVTGLPPMAVNTETPALIATIALPERAPRTVRVTSDAPDAGTITILGEPADAVEQAEVLHAVRHIMRLDEDLSPFYAMARNDPALAWVVRGAGRMTRGQSVFEDVVKTICTTNCAWSATERMVTALVAHLGEPTPDAPHDTWEGRAFPTPRALVEADDAFYRDHVRCGYRGPYLRKLARMVVDGEFDLDALGAATPEDLPDDEMAKQLVALPGVGPYAAAHIMMMLGRYSRLIFDSWTRPSYAKLRGRERVPDAEIAEHFAPYGRFAGLAFWLTITADWLADRE